jgi:hypothetical protein
VSGRLLSPWTVGHPSAPGLVRVGEPDGDAARPLGPALPGDDVPVGEQDAVRPDCERRARVNPIRPEVDPNEGDRGLIAVYNASIVDLCSILLVLQRLGCRVELRSK